MTANFSKRRAHQPRQSKPASAEVTIQIAERDGQHVLVVRETSPVDSQVVQRAVAWSGAVAEAEASPKAVRFANESEAEFARILTFYHIDWQYEPHSFAIEWDAAGEATSFFTPDFYLPQHNLYIELTTLRQPLVTRKNRKIRRLRALYPEVNLKVLYAADYRKLVEKFAGSQTWQEGSGDK